MRPPANSDAAASRCHVTPSGDRHTAADALLWSGSSRYPPATKPLPSVVTDVIAPATYGTRRSLWRGAFVHAAPVAVHAVAPSRSDPTMTSRAPFTATAVADVAASVTRLSIGVHVVP